MSEKKKSVEELLEEISEKLDNLTGLIAIQGKEENLQIKILTSLGFDSKEVGNFLGIPSGTIRRRNLEMRNIKK